VKNASFSAPVEKTLTARACIGTPPGSLRIFQSKEKVVVFSLMFHILGDLVMRRPCHALAGEWAQGWVDERSSFSLSTPLHTVRFLVYRFSYSLEEKLTEKQVSGNRQFRY
jgi:hypothetical protein